MHFSVLLLLSSFYRIYMIDKLKIKTTMGWWCCCYGYGEGGYCRRVSDDDEENNSDNDKNVYRTSQVHCEAASSMRLTLEMLSTICFMQSSQPPPNISSYFPRSRPLLPPLFLTPRPASHPRIAWRGSLSSS